MGWKDIKRYGKFSISPSCRGDKGYNNPKDDPTVPPSLLDWAWAVGIYEGEGFCCNPAKDTPVARVGQCDPWLIHKLRELFGGTARPQTRNGIVAYFWQWTLCCSRAKGFLLTIYPHLSPKRRQQVRNVLRHCWEGLIVVEP